MSYRILISVKEKMQTCILEIFFLRDASAFQIDKGTEKYVKYDIESFLSLFLQQLPVWIAL